MHGKRGKIIGRRELWGANRRPVNQPPIIIDTGSTSLPFLSQRVLPRSSAAIRRPTVRSRKPALHPLATDPSPTPCFHPSTCRGLGIPPPGVTNAPPIPSFISQMCCKTAAIHFRSSRFSFPLRGSALMAVRAALCSRAMVLSFHDGTIVQTSADNTISRR